jgi:hypothetical protein
MKTEWYLYKSPNGWRWRASDYRNGRTIGASTESYSRRVAAVANLRRLTGRRFEQFRVRNFNLLIA